MAIPARNAAPKEILSPSRTFFVTTKTIQGRHLLQSDAFANLLIDVLRSHAKRFTIHDFVVMPNHLHLLMTLDDAMSIEKAMQLIKGGFSYRLKRELGYSRDVWQRGYSEVRVKDRESFWRIAITFTRTPLKRAWWNRPRTFLIAPFTSKIKRPQGLKPHNH